MRAVLAMAGKDLRIALGYRLAFASAIFGSFWGLLSMRVVSKIVDGGQFHGSRTAYFDFTVVGIMLVVVLERSATAGAENVRSDQVRGTLEYLASQPIPRFALGLGWSLYSMIQSVVVAIAVVGLTTALGFRVAHVDTPVILAAVLLSIMIFLALGNVGIAVVLVFQQGTGVIVLVVGLAALLGGTLYPVAELPHLVQPLVHLSPLTYALAALRSSLLAGQPPTSAAHDLLILVGFAAVLVPLSAIVLRVAFSAAERRGTLSTY